MRSASPLFRSLSDWRLRDAAGDLAAGLTLAAIAIPEQMATARLAGFPPAAGFYVFIGGALAFAVFGASRSLSVGADSTIAPIFAGALATLAAVGTAYASLAATLALMVGIVLIIAGVLRLGWVANLLSVPVTTGFLAGIAVHIAVSQLAPLTGLHDAGGSVLRRLADLLAQGDRVNPYCVSLGVGVFALTLISERLSPRMPGAFFAVLAATMAMILLHLDSRGVAAIGGISGELPHIALPETGSADIFRLVGLATIVSLVVMLQTGATTRAFAPGDAQTDVNGDFIGVGAASIAAGLLGGFPLNASPPRTAVAVQSGGRSQLASLLAALAVGLVIAYARSLLQNIPAAALSGVLLFVAFRLVRHSTMADVYRRSVVEFLLILATLTAIVVLPIQLGVAAGIFLSLLHGVWTTTRTEVIELERIAGSSVWWPAGKSHSGKTIDGILVLAFQAPLSFLNADDFRRGVLAAVARSPSRLRLVVIEANNIAGIDYSAAQVLLDLLRQLREENVSVSIARLESIRAQQEIERFGIMDALGRGRVFRSVQEAIDAFEAGNASLVGNRL